MPAEPAQPASPPPGPMHCAVLGSPVAHSLSPVLHRAAYRELGLDWTYDAHEVTERELAPFLAGLTGRWRGLSLTMPLKRRVVGLCDDVEEMGRLLTSVNTVVLDGDGRRSGYNTDVPGFVDAFGDAGVTHLESVIVVGAGATAASALAAASQLGASRAVVMARSLSRADALARLGPSLGLDVLLLDIAEPPPSSLNADALVSTIPAGVQLPLAGVLAALAPVVFDVVYHPRTTALTAAATSRGLTVVDGFALLLHQAARQVELMTGTAQAPLEQMRSAGLTELGNR